MQLNCVCFHIGSAGCFRRRLQMVLTPVAECAFAEQILPSEIV